MSPNRIVTFANVVMSAKYLTLYTFNGLQYNDNYKYNTAT